MDLRHDINRGVLSHRGTPSQKIHFRFGFSMVNHPAIGYPHGMPHRRVPTSAPSIHMGCPKMGDTQEWMVTMRGKIPSFEMNDDWGYPYVSGKLHWFVFLQPFSDDLSPPFRVIILVASTPKFQLEPNGCCMSLLVKNPNSCCFLTGWWLGHPSEKYEFVNWDDEIPNINGKIKNGIQTTNQLISESIPILR